MESKSRSGNARGRPHTMPAPATPKTSTAEQRTKTPGRKEARNELKKLTACNGVGHTEAALSDRRQSLPPNVIYTPAMPSVNKRRTPGRAPKTPSQSGEPPQPGRRPTESGSASLKAGTTNERTMQTAPGQQHIAKQVRPLALSLHPLPSLATWCPWPAVLPLCVIAR